MIKQYDIIPVAKPRMTRSDRWKKRPPVLKYFAFKDEVRLKGLVLNESGDHIIFGIPMPKSWSKKKRTKMLGKPHQQRPDNDNLLKAIQDSIFDEDCRIWDIRSSKVWAENGNIIIKQIEGS